VISRRTKIQLLFFVIITLVGVSYVGARYARLDRLLFDDTYTVVAHFPDSGGSFDGAEVSYRGVTIGQISDLELTKEGVDAHLSIDNKWDKIPKDSIALVGNRSAIGEQYVELQPSSDGGPYLKDESEIPMANTRLPIPTVKLLTDISNTVENVDKDSLQTVVTELGLAFDDTGKDLAQIIDTSNSFIEAADQNFETTTALIRDSNTVLHGQLDSASAIRNFSKNLALFSTSLAGSDQDIRQLIDSGATTANELRSFIEDNKIDLAALLNNLRTTGEIQVKNIDGLSQIFVAYPLVVEGGFTVVAKDPVTKKYDAHFGMIMTNKPEVCHAGYQDSDVRPPQNTGWRDMYVQARCTEPPTKSNARGAQNAPRAATSYSSPIVARFDPETGKLTWTRHAADLQTTGTVTPQVSGEESWKWLLLQGVQTTQ
jgi:phospholipid/cholesterol/gamma-HCH transport system substrate-binding protein